MGTARWDFFRYLDPAISTASIFELELWYGDRKQRGKFRTPWYSTSAPIVCPHTSSFSNTPVDSSYSKCFCFILFQQVGSSPLLVWREFEEERNPERLREAKFCCFWGLSRQSGKEGTSREWRTRDNSEVSPHHCHFKRPASTTHMQLKHIHCEARNVVPVAHQWNRVNASEVCASICRG